MRLALIDDVGFAVSADNAWISFESIGLAARTTAEAISRVEEARGSLRAGPGTRVKGEPGFMAPVVTPGKIIAIGLNYMDHVRETGASVPEEPVVFAKFTSALTGPTDPIVLDASATQAADYESELAVVIGTPLRNVGREEALAGVFGYCVANDVSARDIQSTDPRITRAKSLDTFCPIGPWITTRDEIPDPQTLAVRSEVNGEVRQDSNTEQMIFSAAALLEHLSRGTTLQPGDVVLTGTPPGVGFAMDPPRYLQEGDVVVCEIDGLGRLENRVVSYK
jgi:2-keto-4-pentenoate hydratase/2-oxohepta-3-ene-1,7-dioic acid hydratase in catechol pathway